MPRQPGKLGGKTVCCELCGFEPEHQAVDTKTKKPYQWKKCTDEFQKKITAILGRDVTPGPNVRVCGPCYGEVLRMIDTIANFLFNVGSKTWSTAGSNERSPKTLVKLRNGCAVWPRV